MSESASAHPERLQQSSRVRATRLKDEPLNPNELLPNIKYNALR